MKTLMFGWEFPPHLFEELGTSSHEPTIKVDFSIMGEVKHRIRCYNTLLATLKKIIKRTSKLQLGKGKKIKTLYDSVYTKYLAEA